MSTRKCNTLLISQFLTPPIELAQHVLWVRKNREQHKHWKDMQKKNLSPLDWDQMKSKQKQQLDNLRPGPSLTRGPVASLSGESVGSLWEFAFEKALSLGSVSAMSDAASLSSSSGWVKIQSSARSRLLFWKKFLLQFPVIPNNLSWWEHCTS